MKKLRIILPLLLIISFFTCCSDNGAEAIDGGLASTWILYESGYSPGGGYITNAVPSEPAQTITLHSDSTFTSMMPGYTGYKTYRVKNNVLSFFKTDKSLPGMDTLNYSYELEGNNLRLYFRYCIEGCHMAFRRVEE